MKRAPWNTATYRVELLCDLIVLPWLAGADGAGGADDAGGADGDEVVLGLAGDGGASDIDFLYDSICWFCTMSRLLSQHRLRVSGFLQPGPR